MAVDLKSTSKFRLKTHNKINKGTMAKLGPGKTILSNKWDNFGIVIFWVTKLSATCYSIAVCGVQFRYEYHIRKLWQYKYIFLMTNWLSLDNY